MNIREVFLEERPASSHFNWVISLLILMGATSLGSTSELVVRDIDTRFELLPTSFSYAIKDTNGSRSGDDAFKKAYGLAIGCPYSFAGAGDTHGFLAAGELAVNQATYGSIGHLTSYGLRVEGGYGYALNDDFMFSIMAIAGLGTATFDVTSNAEFNAFSASGLTMTYGLMLGSGYAINDNVLISAKLGYLSTSDKLSGGGVKIDLTNSGTFIAFGVSYRFSARPRPLE